MAIRFCLALTSLILAGCGETQKSSQRKSVTSGTDGIENATASDSTSEVSTLGPNELRQAVAGSNVVQERFNGDKWASLSRPNLTVFKGSDLLFSVRKGRCSYNPAKPDDDCIPEIDRFIDGFEPNRLVWHYPVRNLTSSISDPTAKPSLILPKFRGIDPAPQCSINVFVDVNDKADVHCRDLNGETVKADWEIWDGISRPDVLKDTFLDLHKRHVRSLVASGCRILQQDSVALNSETFNWGGCFSREGDRKFREFLRERFGSGLKQLSNDVNAASDSFSITAYFKTKGALEIRRDRHGKQNLSAWMDSVENKENKLLHLYREFSGYKSLEYLQLMKVTAKQAAGGAYVPLSGNVADYDKNFPLYQVLDFMTAEWVSEQRTLPGFLKMVMFSDRMGKKLVGTPATNDLNLHRSLFSSAYALGNHMIIPYDVYIDSNTPRFHAPVDGFKDLSDFVRSNAAMLDDTHNIETYGNARELITRVHKYCNNTGSVCEGEVWNKTMVQHARMKHFAVIPKGATVSINGREFTTVAPSSDGNIFLAASTWNALKDFKINRLGIETISAPNGSVMNLLSSTGSIKMPNMSTPRVVSIDYGVSKLEHTSIRTTLSDQDLPRGTEIGFAEARYNGATDVGTEVGQLYFNENLIDRVFPGQALSWIKKPGGNKIFFESANEVSTALTLPEGHHDLFVSVRRKVVGGKTQSIVHLTNWMPQLVDGVKQRRNTTLNVEFAKIFGFQPTASTRCTFSQSGSPDAVTLTPVRAPGESSRHRIAVRDLWTWGILTCQ